MSVSSASPKKTRSRQARQGRNGRSRSGGGRWLWTVLRWSLVGLIWLMIGGMAVLAWFAWDLPDVDSVSQVTRRPAITVKAADGTELVTVGDYYGSVVSVEEMPPYLPGAVMAIEDRGFYDHFGLDPRGLARAMWVNLREQRLLQGGSTISQQAAKNLFLSHERTIKRKVQELMLAFWLEYRYSKNQIFTLYLNRVYLGAGTYGMEAAAQRYFNRSARDVTVYQAAVLAGLLKAPSRYNPVADPKAAQDRAAVVLNAMVETGVVTADQAQAARSSGGQAVAGVRRSGSGRYFSDWVVDQVDAYLGEISEDIVVHTTLDMRLEKAAEAALVRTLEGDGAKRNAGQGAVVVLTPDGAVRAMVGGRDYARSQYNRAVQSQRQPGSAFKPFVFLTAIEAGMGPDDGIEDGPLRIGKWTPTNFEPGYAGRVSLREALARSMNTATVRLSEQVGRRQVIATAQRLGMTIKADSGPSLALGAEETGLLPLVAAYAPFANGGQGVIPYGVTEITSRDGRILYRRDGSGLGRVIADEHVGAMNDMLAAVVAGGTGRGAALDRPVGGKTGTSQDYRDAWFVGFTADHVAGVWVGNDDNSPMTRVTGGSLPVRVWKDVMVVAGKGLPARALPGRRPGQGDPFSRLFQSIFGSDTPSPAAAPATGRPESRPGGGFHTDEKPRKKEPYDPFLSDLPGNDPFR